MLGDEVLDVAEQDTSRDNSHLFVRHAGLVQALGPLKSKMNFRPSSLDSRSHKQLTAIVDKRHAKVGACASACACVAAVGLACSISVCIASCHQLAVSCCVAREREQRYLSPRPSPRLADPTRHRVCRAICWLNLRAAPPVPSTCFVRFPGNPA